MIKIKLSNGKQTIVDDDMAHLKNYRWQYHWAGYPQRPFIKENKEKRSMFPHHAVIGQPLKSTKMVVDHINRNTLDNRKKNLRIVTIRENSSNQNRKAKGKTSSKYVGVHLNEYIRKNGLTTKKWIAQIAINGKRSYLGAFQTERLAYKAYCEKLERIKNG